MDESPRCQQCEAPLTGQAVGGLCANCLLRLALDRPPEVTLRTDESENGIANPPAAPREAVGSRIGRYKLLQEIGEGGFGVVYLAEQLEPVKRRVALKVLKPGMDTREVVARFEAERQALAMMDHSNIARVFDAGATGKGRLFFVMELVKGIPITKFCDEQKFTTRQRLELFGDVCSAINHAHQKGIVYRDIKPSNVMVTLNCDRAVVKVIDFGIAKATQGRLTDKTLFTRFEQFVGTPAYMSPEQAAISELDIDTRSDIYALGVLLYELLTGKPPFDAKALVSAGYEEMRRIIREVEPAKPSTRLSSICGDERTSVARARHSEPDKLSRLVEPDLDWIVMKAIEKDRTRRCETANGFALDIQRFLADEPVLAAAPSVAYLFRKFARRHQAAMGLAVLIAVVLVAAAGISLWQAKLAVAAKRETDGALAEVEKQKAEVDRRNTQYRAMLAEADRSDRAIADAMLRAGLERESFAYLARACGYEPLSTFAAQKAVIALNSWRSPLPTAILTGHEGAVTSAQFNPNGSCIVTASKDKTVRLWAAATGKCLATFAGHGAGVNNAQFSRDGSRIVTVSNDKTARVWDVTTGKCLTTLEGHEAGVRSAEFSRDGSRIVTASNDRTARVWDAVTGKCLITLERHTSPVDIAQFSPDGSRIVTVAYNYAALLWDTATGKFLEQVQHEAWGAEFNSDGSRIVTGSEDHGWLSVLDVATGKYIARLSGHAYGVSSAQFSPNGSRIITSSVDKTVRVWDAETGQSILTLAGHEYAVNGAQFSPNGLLIISGSGDKTARVWDATTGQCETRLQTRLQTPTYSRGTG